MSQNCAVAIYFSPIFLCIFLCTWLYFLEQQCWSWFFVVASDLIRPCLALYTIWWSHVIIRITQTIFFFSLTKKIKMSWHQFWYSNHICLSYGQSDCEIFPQLINAFCFYENSAVLICSFYPNLCKQYYLKNLVLIDLPEAHQDFLVGVIGSFWHKIKNFWGSKFESVHIARIIFFHIDLTTWPNLTKFCSLTLAGASPRTPLWTLGCLKI